MNTTTAKTKNQQPIEENLPNHDENTNAPPKPLKRAERRQMKSEADKQAKKARKAAGNPRKGSHDSAPTLTEEQLQKIQKSMDSLKKGMVGNTWRTLEVGRVFKQNAKIELITDKTLVVGVDVASNKHDMRAFTNRGIEVSSRALEFANSREGFETAYSWILELMTQNGMEQAVIGLEPTGHYWFNLYWWMIDHKITVVLVNPFAVNRIKEVDDNQQLKTDMKDPKTIAGLVKDGRYSVPYLPDGDYAELRGYAQLRDAAIDELVRAKNRLHRWANIYFPSYESLYEKIDAVGGLLLLSMGIVPKDIVEMGVDGILSIWRNATLRGQGKAKATKIYEAARDELQYGHGYDSARMEVKWLAEDIQRLQERFRMADEKMQEYSRKIADTTNVEAIAGVTINTFAPLLADLGDLSRFDNDEEIAKLSGVIPVIQESGKCKGQAKISRRGRKRIRKNLYKMAMCVVANAPEFKELHTYYTTREKNPLKKCSR